MHFNLTFMNENSNPGNMGQMPAGGGSGTQNDNTQYVGGPTGPSVPPPPYGPQGFGPQGFGPQMGPHATVVPAPSFFECVKLYFTQYAKFTGRSRRSEYWYVVLFNFLVGIVLSLSGVQMLGYIYSLATFVPDLALQCRRLHDINRSGHWLWVKYLAIIFGYIAALYFVIYMIVYVPEMTEALKMQGTDPSLFYPLYPLLNLPSGVIILMVLCAIGIGITFLVFNCTDSKQGTNAYGASPKYPD